MTTEALLNLASRKSYEVFYADLASAPSFTLEENGCHIVLDKRLSPIREKECLAHELGHCEYGGFYNRCSPYDLRAKAERRADKWAYRKLVPPGAVKAAFRRGLLEPWELADEFQVSCEYMQSVLSYYRQASIL